MGTPRLVATLFPKETPHLVAMLFLTATMSPITTLRSMGNAVPNRNAASAAFNGNVAPFSHCSR